MACTSADLGPSIGQFGKAVEDTSKAVQPALDRGVARESASVVARAARADKDIYDFPQACVDVAFGLDGADGTSVQAADCALMPKVKVPAPRGSASYADKGMQALRAYARTLDALAGSTVAGDVSTNFKDFAGSLNAFAEEVNADEGAVVITPGRVDGIAGLLGTAVDARRRAILRKLVNTAHPDIEVLVAELIAHFDAKDGLTDGSDRLRKAWERMSRARGTPGYLAAVRAYEGEFGRYQKRLKRSNTAALLRVWRSQQLLHAKLQSRRDTALIEKLVKDVKALGG